MFWSVPLTGSTTAAVYRLLHDLEKSKCGPVYASGQADLQKLFSQ